MLKYNKHKETNTVYVHVQQYIAKKNKFNNTENELSILARILHYLGYKNYYLPVDTSEDLTFNDISQRSMMELVLGDIYHKVNMFVCLRKHAFDLFCANCNIVQFGITNEIYPQVLFNIDKKIKLLQHIKYKGSCSGREFKSIIDCHKLSFIQLKTLSGLFDVLRVFDDTHKTDDHITKSHLYVRFLKDYNLSE